MVEIELFVVECCNGVVCGRNLVVWCCMELFNIGRWVICWDFVSSADIIEHSHRFEISRSFGSIFWEGYVCIWI